MADDEFIEFYAKKEIKRFGNTKLFDTISRVGREPLRKLKGSDRLIQSAKFIQETNQNSDAINLTIKIALYDAINNYKKELLELEIIPSEKEILKNISNLNENESLFKELTSKNIFKTIFLCENQKLQH